MEFKRGDRVRVEIEGEFYGTDVTRRVLVDVPFGMLNAIDPKHVKRIGKKPRPNQVWERDGERFYVESVGRYVSLARFKGPGEAQTGFSLEPGKSLENEGFELVLDVEESN